MGRTVVFTDVQGNELFALKNKHFTIHKSFHAEGPNGKDLFVVKGEFSCQSPASKVAITKILSQYLISPSTRLEVYRAL